MNKHIAELEKVLEALREKEEILRYIVRHDPNAIAVYDCNLYYIAVSERYLSDYNVKEEDIIGKHHYEVFPEMPQRWKEVHKRCLAGEILRNEDDCFERLDGSITYNRWECRPWRRMNGEIDGMITYTEVTTERKQAELRLKESEEMMRYIVRHDPNALAVYDCDLRYIAVSERYLVDYHVKEEDIIGKHHYEVFPEMPQRWKEVHKRCLAGEILRNEDDCFERLDGSITYNRWECRPWRRMNGEIGGMITYTEVTTEKKKAEIVLKANEEKYRYIFANNPQPMWIFDYKTLRFLEVNEAAIRHYGYSREEFMQMTLKDIRPAQDVAYLMQQISQRDDLPYSLEEIRHIKKNGEIIHVEITAHTILFEGREACHVLINDITKRKTAEQSLLHVSRLYAVLSQINQAIVHTRSQEELFAKICQISVDQGQFKMAWIGLVDEKENRLKPVAQAGYDHGYVANVSIAIYDPSTGRGPTGQSVFEGRINTSPDIATDPRMAPWRDDAIKRGYRSSAAVPFSCKGKVVGVLSLYAKDIGFFTDDEQRLLKEIGEDISFSLTAMAIEQENKHAREELIRSELRYRRLFESSKDGILLIDGESGIANGVNASMSIISEYTHDKLLKKPIWENEFFRQIVPDNDFFVDIQKSNRQRIREMSLHSREGNPIHAEVVFNSYLVNNQKMVQCSLRDITSRKSAELKLKDALAEAQRFRQTLDHVSSYIYMKDLQSRYIYANKHTQVLFDCLSDELVGSDDYRFFPPETANYLRELDQRVFRGEETREEIVVHDPVNGMRVYLEVKVPIYASLEDKTICGLLGISTDITDRKLIEDRLKESEERFRTVAQSTTDVIYEWDLNEKIDWYGDIDQMMGFMPREFPREFKEFKMIIHPEDIDPMVASLSSIVAKGYPNTIEYRVRKKDGEWCWWSARRTLVKDPTGAPVKLIGSITDITERKKSRDELKFQADLLSNVGQAVVATDNESKITYWNKAAEKMYGWAAAQAIGQNVMDLNPAEVSPEVIQEVVSAISQGNSWTGELRVKRRDGHSFPIYVTNSPIYDSNGKLSGIVNISSDISERKTTEEKITKLSRAIEQTIDTIVITNRNGIIEYVNHSFEDITGYSAAEALGKTPRILKSGNYEPGFYEEMWATILSGKVYRTEIINKKKNGELYYVEITISPIFDQNRHITHFVGTGVDISARKRAEQDLIRAKEKAEESDRLKSAFLANMSHEVKTPLNSILGFSSLLADTEFDKAERDEFIHHIINNGNQLLHIITDIIDISKIEAGVINIEKTPVNAHQLITQIKEQFLYELKNKDLELQIHGPDPDKEMIIHADYYRLIQVFNNLLSNALKFTEKGKISIGYLPKEEYVEFFVKDTGIGIPKEFHDKIFERFRQVEEKKTRKYGGNGLGLAITKNLVELMDGRIWLESEPGKGSTFYFTLPRREG